MTDAMSHHFSLACVPLDRQCALPCIGMLAGAMSRMFVGFPGCIVRPRRAAAHVQIQQRFILAILDRYQSHLLNMQQEGKINMEVIQTLANEKMLANYIDHKCACCAVLCGAVQASAHAAAKPFPWPPCCGRSNWTAAQGAAPTLPEAAGPPALPPQLSPTARPTGCCRAVSMRPCACELCHAVLQALETDVFFVTYTA